MGLDNLSTLTIGYCQSRKPLDMAISIGDSRWGLTYLVRRCSRDIPLVIDTRDIGLALRLGDERGDVVLGFKQKLDLTAIHQDALLCLDYSRSEPFDALFSYHRYPGAGDDIEMASCASGVQ